MVQEEALWDSSQCQAPEQGPRGAPHGAGSLSKSTATRFSSTSVLWCALAGFLDTRCHRSPWCGSAAMHLQGQGGNSASAETVAHCTTCSGLPAAENSTMHPHKPLEPSHRLATALWTTDATGMPMHRLCRPAPSSTTTHQVPACCHAGRVPIPATVPTPNTHTPTHTAQTRSSPLHHLLLRLRRAVLPLKPVIGRPEVANVRVERDGSVEPGASLVHLAVVPEQVRHSRHHVGVVVAALESIHCANRKPERRGPAGLEQQRERGVGCMGARVGVWPGRAARHRHRLCRPLPGGGGRQRPAHCIALQAGRVSDTLQDSKPGGSRQAPAGRAAAAAGARCPCLQPRMLLRICAPDLLFRAGRGAKEIDSAHRMPLSGQSCTSTSTSTSTSVKIHFLRYLPLLLLLPLPSPGTKRSVAFSCDD